MALQGALFQRHAHRCLADNGVEALEPKPS